MSREQPSPWPVFDELIRLFNLPDEKEICAITIQVSTTTLPTLTVVYEKTNPIPERSVRTFQVDEREPDHEPA